MKKIYFPARILALTGAMLLWASCEDETGTGGNPTEKQTVDEWIVNFLQTEYLWNEEAKEKTPDHSSPERLFYSLLSLNDGKDNADGTHYYYSYIEKNTSATRSIDTESTYGFEFALYNIADNKDNLLGYCWARVLYVLPDSPAAKAGLKRDDWISKINGQAINADNYGELMKGPDVRLSLNVSTLPGTQEKEIPLAASIHMDENPLLLDTVLYVQDTKVGYLVYNQFKTGKEDNADDHTYDNDMTERFKDFADEGVTEFVLDLRYNGGGYLSSAQLLGGFFVSDADRNGVFCLLEDNKGHKESYQFQDKGCHLGLSRLFILTSSQTASASEAIINGLKPYMDVILIGGTTEGKNVGSIHEEYEDWAMQPIVSRIYNREGVSGYENGFTPEAAFLCDELSTAENATLRPLGDRREYMLAKALAVIGQTAEPASAPSLDRNRRTGSTPVYRSTERKSRNAVLIR